jgi:hypothetical protein
MKYIIRAYSYSETYRREGQQDSRTPERQYGRTAGQQNSRLEGRQVGRTAGCIWQDGRTAGLNAPEMPFPSEEDCERTFGVKQTSKFHAKYRITKSIVDPAFNIIHLYHFLFNRNTCISRNMDRKWLKQYMAFFCVLNPHLVQIVTWRLSSD